MDEPIIIGVSGYKQSGKSSLCDYLDAWWNAQFINSEVRIYSFADPLKEFCINVLNLKEEQCYGTDDQKNTPTQYVWDNLPDKIRLAYAKDKIKQRAVRSISSNDFGSVVWDEWEEFTPRTGPITGREMMQLFGTDIMRKFFSDMIWVNGTIRKIKRDKFPLSLISDVRFVSEVNAVLGESNGYIIRLTRKIDNADKHPSEVELDNYNWNELSDRCLLIDNTNQEISYKNDLAVRFLRQILMKHNYE